MKKKTFKKNGKAFTTYDAEISSELVTQKVTDENDLTYRQNSGDYVGGKSMEDLIQFAEDQVIKK
ncbi:hypothetical protein [Inediibacterium massiliense]|uniref:hypothetical protein n=1 Tax=Inediibacterium massiliense TaxID=1658111 RepID=UPI0006B57E86|nr:hypothetical protein [Inediibacterium massiliense]